jgi:hypothetical protein
MKIGKNFYMDDEALIILVVVIGIIICVLSGKCS